MYPLLLAALALFRLTASAADYREISVDDWEGDRVEVKGLEGEHAAVIAYPVRSSTELRYRSAEALGPGLYRLRLTLRPSHVGDAVAWSSGLRVEAAGARALTPAEWQGIHFTRINQPEVKNVDFVKTTDSPLSVRLSAFADAGVFDTAAARKAIDSGAVAVPDAVLAVDDDDQLDGLSLELFIEPATHFYYLLEKAELARLSASACVERVEVDKLRYVPGETLKADVTLRGLAPRAQGTLRLYLEHGVAARELVRELPVDLEPGTRTLQCDVPLPRRELGHALVARYESDDGADLSEAAEYFTIADNFYRVGIHYVHPITHETFRGEDALRGGLLRFKRDYIHCREIFFWAEEDMVELSPDDEYWFSGQTCYHMCKQGLKDYIRIAHELGIAISTYGKFIMSGYLGWKTAYDYPFDHKEQYGFSIGMWEGCNVPELDRFMNKEFTANPPVDGGVYGKEYAGLSFMPINPDPTPRNVRRAAEEMIRSIEMFGWDGVRWDGHPRGASPYGTSCGGLRNEKYSYEVQRKTQMLVRYFKDVVGAEYPRFRHGYNYLHYQSEPFYEWAYEDFELDELCRGGGLVMNESIRNSQGRTFEWVARNLQVEGDLARERGGYLLCIACDHVSPRDTFAEMVLYFAAGARPYIGSNRLINRYGTRFSRYVFDERLRRIAEPEQILRPTSDTRLWWTPFVYETPEEDGKRQLVVNLLNIPPRERISAMGAPDPRMDLAPGSEPLDLAVSLPDGFTAGAAHLIDPFTLRVEALPVQTGGGGRTISVPPVSIWAVLVLDLETAPGVVGLAERWGPPRTLGVKRESLDVARSEPEPLDVEKPVEDVNKRMTHLFPAQSSNPWWRENPDYPGMSWETRNQSILETRLPAEHYIKGYPYGLQLPRDQELQDGPPAFGDLTPRRNGVMDVFYARGAIDYRLRCYEALARFPRMFVHEARYQAPFSGKHHSLSDGIPPDRLPEFDVALFTSIPHPAIGAERSYGLADYVNAGGGALFFGGEYAFGKGRYAYTVLERELLPVVCVQQLDNRYAAEPLQIEPGPQFGELDVSLAFDEAPVFWGWNQVALKDDPRVKVFLKSGNRPVLVGWDYGQGRVACFLAMYRGASEDGAMAFFDWNDWPRLLAATLAWLAPRAAEFGAPPPPLSAAELADLREELQGGVLEDMMEGVLGGDDETLMLGEPSGGTGGNIAATTLSKAELRERTAMVRRLLESEGAETASLLADQLATVANLGTPLRFEIVEFVRRHPFAGIGRSARRCMASQDHDIRGCGFQLLALAKDPEFARIAVTGPPAMEVRPIDRARYLALAAALYERDDLRRVAAERVTEWNARERQVQERYTNGKGFSMAAPETMCLDSEALFARIGWLAYLSQWEPEEHAAQFARQWAMIGQYSDYCDRTVRNLHESISRGPVTASQRAAVRQRSRDLAAFKVYLDWMSRATRPRLDALCRSHPREVATGLAQGRFLCEIKQALNVVGGLDGGSAGPMLETLQHARHELLASFARARLAAE